MGLLKKTTLESGERKPWYREWSEALIVAIVLALIIRTFLFQAFKIPSGSMLDTLLIGDHLLVNKFIYGTHLPFSDERFLSIREPQRGDVIVFEFPGDEDKSYFKRRDFIKRVIGEPGDKVEIREKKVFVNGTAYELPQEVHKDSAFVPAVASPRDYSGPFFVPQGKYFVMGDNRDYSYDSRFWGFVPEEKIKGLAFIKYWSWDAQAGLANKVRWSRIGRMID